MQKTINIKGPVQFFPCEACATLRWPVYEGISCPSNHSHSDQSLIKGFILLSSYFAFTQFLCFHLCCIRIRHLHSHYTQLESYLKCASSNYKWTPSPHAYTRPPSRMGKQLSQLMCWVGDAGDAGVRILVTAITFSHATARPWKGKRESNSFLL